MFEKGTMRDIGIDITLKGNPGHVLAPNDWDMVLAVKFKKINIEEYQKWYLDLLAKRWQTRKKEFLDLAKEGLNKDIRLKCFCHKNDTFCHAHLAAKFMNRLVDKIRDLA